MKPNTNSCIFGISLSGGGARGILHIGVLEALRQQGIHPEIISGTSMGALVGVFYASGMMPLQILELVKSSKLHRMIKWKLPSSGLLDLKKVRGVLEKYIPEDDFSTLKKPFCCTVTNLNSGLTETKNFGKLFQWVIASATIPVIFEPQIIDGQTYVDGGLFNSLPVDCIRNECRFLIGVHVNHNGVEENINGFKAIAERTFRLIFAKNVNESFSKCDFVIDPVEMRSFDTFDFGKADEIFKIGFDETQKRMPELLKSIETSLSSGEKMLYNK
ncbi:MAG: patatin-like phospholipase family protein [Prolixibacteraceae bacterium]|jgi:NTE family protein